MRPDRKLNIMDVVTGHVQRICADRRLGSISSWSPCGLFLVGSQGYSNQPEAQIICCRTGRLVLVSCAGSMSHDPSVTFSPNSMSVVIASCDMGHRDIRVYDLSSGHQVLHLADAYSSWSHCYSLKGNLFLAAPNENAPPGVVNDVWCHVYDTKTWKKVSSFATGLSQSGVMTMSPDGCSALVQGFTYADDVSKQLIELLVF